MRPIEVGSHAVAKWRELLDSCRVVVVLGALVLNAIMPLTSAAAAKEEPRLRLLATIESKANRGALYWHGNVMSGDLALFADSVSGELVLRVTSSAGEQSLYGEPPLHPEAKPNMGLSDSAWAAGLERAKRHIRICNDLNRTLVRMQARGEVVSAIGESLTARGRADGDEVESVNYSPIYKSLAVKWRDMPGVELMPGGLIASEDWDRPKAQHDRSHEHDYDAQTIQRELRSGRIILVGPSGGLGIVPGMAGDPAWFQAQVDTVRMGKMPVRSLPLMKTMSHLLVQVPLEQLKR